MTTKTTKTTKGNVSQEREAAKTAGVSLVHYRILKAMSSGGAFSYRNIEAKTGYYSNLTAAMRPNHAGSLGALGLVKEKVLDIDGLKELSFTITPKGLKAIGK